MSGWIINIAGDRPGNWEIAKDNLLWATKSNYSIRAGDDLFFWMTRGGGLIARAVALEDARPVTDSESMPWPDHDEQQYASTFGLAGVAEADEPLTTSWRQLQDWGGFRNPAIQSVIEINSADGVTRLRALFDRSSNDDAQAPLISVDNRGPQITAAERNPESVRWATADNGGRLPNWTWEETLLAWLLYLQEYADPLRYPDRTQEAVRSLSMELRSLRIHPLAVRQLPRFRNPDGVARKIQNLMWAHTKRHGSANASAMDRRIVAEMTDLRAAERVAGALRSDWNITGSPADKSGTARKPRQDYVLTAAYESALDALEGDLERKGDQLRRLEQRYLRQRLFGADQEATCSLCGRLLPVGLLIAAHVKRRSSCSRDEKLDASNIVMPACGLGCDLLYERGYLAVDDSGAIVASKVPQLRELRHALDQLEGRQCSAHHAASAHYFRIHLEIVFMAS